MSGQPTSRARRPRILGVLVAVCLAVGLSAVPGVAAAAPTTSVVPTLDCFRENSDGSYTLVLGYTNSGSKVAIPYGPRNVVSPSAFDRDQPTVFNRGTVPGVFSVRLGGWDLLGFRWSLDEKSVSFWSILGSRECSPSTPLPLLGNGTGLAIALVAGGVFGVLFVRRLIRRVGAGRPLDSTEVGA